jgi:cobalamin synthase
MDTRNNADERLDHPRSRKAFRTTKTLVGGYLGLSVLTLIAIVALRDHPAIVNAAVWIRAVAVVASAALMLFFADRTAKGRGGSYRRLRLVSAIMVVAIVLIIVLPGAFPVWLKVEQGVCGLILLGVVAVVNSKPMRSVFTARKTA